MDGKIANLFYRVASLEVFLGKPVSSLSNYPVKITLQKGATGDVLTGEEPRSGPVLDSWVPGHVLDRLGAQFMYRTGWVPSSCTGQAGYPVHVLDRPGALVTFWTGCVPSSCTGHAGCPYHVLDRLDTFSMY